MFAAVAGPLSVPGAKATLFVSVTMTMLGIWGVVIGYGQLTAPPAEPEPTSELSAEALESVGALQEEMRTAPITRALAAANLLASALMVVSSFLLTARRQSAMWWATQALWANIAYALAAMIGHIALLFQLAPQLERLFVLLSEAQPAEQGAPAPADVAGMLPWVGAGLVVLLTLFTLALYFVLMRISRRPDVRSFVTRQA
jgi:hypothetical protein